METYENIEKQICTIGKFEHTGENSKNKLVIVHTVYSFYDCENFEQSSKQKTEDQTWGHVLTNTKSPAYTYTITMIRKTSQSYKIQKHTTDCLKASQ